MGDPKFPIPESGADNQAPAPDRAITDLIAQEKLTVIHPEKPWEPSANFNYKALEWLGIDEGEFRDWVHDLQRIINSPMIVDRFDEDHTARRKWRTKMEQEHGTAVLDFLYRNKLRKGSFSQVNFIFAGLEFQLRKTEDPRKEKIESIIEKVRKDYLEAVGMYDKLNIQEKQATMQKLDSLFTAFLEALQA